MITKENLVGMLEKCVQNEDEFIINYGASFLEAINNSGFLSNDEKKEIAGLLTAMLEDTKRHKQVVISLKDRIKGDKRNEF